MPSREGQRRMNDSSTPRMAWLAPENAVRRWEAAYWRYTVASKTAAGAHAGDERSVGEMVTASRAVADAWRAMELAVPDLPWWTLAAVSAAAQAFEFQARDWSVDIVDMHVARLRAPTRQLSVRPGPTPHRRDSGER